MVQEITGQSLVSSINRKEFSRTRKYCEGLKINNPAPTNSLEKPSLFQVNRFFKSPGPIFCLVYRDGIWFGEAFWF